MCTRVSNSQPLDGALLMVHCVCPSLQDKFVSKEGKSKHQLWQELCVLISKNPGKVGYTYNDVHFTSMFFFQLVT